MIFIDFYTRISHYNITTVRKGEVLMEACASTVNSDASENVIYNNPADFRAVSHWHDDLEFTLQFEVKFKSTVLRKM